MPLRIQFHAQRPPASGYAAAPPSSSRLVPISLLRVPWAGKVALGLASAYTRSSRARARGPGNPKIVLLIRRLLPMMLSSTLSSTTSFSPDFLLALARCPASSSLGCLGCSSTASADMYDPGDNGDDGRFSTDGNRRFDEERLTGVPGPQPLRWWGLRPPTGCSSGRPLLDCAMATKVRRRRPIEAMATQTRWCWCQCCCRFFAMARHAWLCARLHVMHAQ